MILAVVMMRLACFRDAYVAVAFQNSFGDFADIVNSLAAEDGAQLADIQEFFIKVMMKDFTAVDQQCRPALDDIFPSLRLERQPRYEQA
jgi:hypothetical protein